MKYFRSYSQSRTHFRCSLYIVLAVSHFFSLQDRTTSVHIFQPLMDFHILFIQWQTEVMFNNNPTLKPRINHHICKTYPIFEQIFTLNVMLYLCQKHIYLQQEVFNGSYFSKLCSIKNRNHLCIDTTNPVSHFCTLVLVIGYKSTACVELFSKIPAYQLTLCDDSSIVNKHRYFTIYFLISSQCLSVDLNKVRCFSLVPKTSFDKLNREVFFNCGNQCTLSVWTKFIVDYLNACLIVHQKQYKLADRQAEGKQKYSFLKSFI